MAVNAYVIVVAGGRGTRMGSDIPKQFLLLAGRPVLMHTLETFSRAMPGIHIVLVLPADQQDYWRELCRHHVFHLPHDVVDGGSTRFESVAHGLAAIPAEVTDALVGVHDGVRPCVADEVIRRCYERAAAEGAVIPVVPVVETVRQTEGTCSHTIDRDTLRLVQTPQVFRLDLLRRAYLQPYTPAFTDDASVVEAAGHPVVLVAGNRENIKITTPWDLHVAETLISSEKRGHIST